MHVIISNNIRCKDPSTRLIEYCKETLTIPNPDWEKKQRMGFWTGGTPRYLFLYEQHGEDYILPFGCLHDIVLSMPCELSSEFSEPDYVDYGADIPLYDYQQTAVDAMYEAREGILQAPAGSGKTQMGIALIAKWGRKALWLTHTQDLLNQSMERAERYIDKSHIGKISEGKVAIGNITFATIQTMCRLDLSRYKDMWDVIIVDECHRVAGTPTAMTQFYKVLNALAARHKYGLSATVHRSDGMIEATYAILGRVAYEVPESSVEDKIMRVGVCPISTGIGLKREALNTDGTLCYSRMINSLCANEHRNEIITAYIMQESEHPCLILSDRLEHLQSMINLLPTWMRDACVMISGKMTSKAGKAAREQAIEDMRNGKKQFLFATYSLAKEGLDIPRLERLFLTTPQKDYAVITQSIGRIARTCQGKEPPIAYDFVDNSRYLVNAYKKRCTTYKKNKCYWVEDNA